MASSSDESSSKAPEQFRISNNSNDEDDDCEGCSQRNYGKPIATIRCPLCCKLQKRFYCRSCLKDGEFRHSTFPHGESLVELQSKFTNLDSSLKIFSARYERVIRDQKGCENILSEIKKKKLTIAILRKLLSGKQENINLLTAQRDELARANAEKRKNLPNYPIKVKELENYVLDRFEKIGILRDKYSSLLNEQQKATRCNIQQLMTFIFPISEIVLKDETRQRTESATKNVSPEDSETIAALADAKNTSYIRGKWVIHGSGISEMQYRIVAPSLPANGDYSAYLDWLSENKDDVPKTTANEIKPSRVTAFRIVGALTYTTQLIQLMSYYLDVRLPYKLAYGDFCKKLNEEQFTRKVSRLNSNIMYLAYTQQVQLRTLNENHTLENILTILDLGKSNLGRHGHNEISNAPLIKSVDSLLLGIETTTESESEDENSLRLDWEAVPSMPPQHEIMNSELMGPAGQQSTIAEGLMTSAANRITSILRWIK